MTQFQGRQDRVHGKEPDFPQIFPQLWKTSGKHFPMLVRGRTLTHAPSRDNHRTKDVERRALRAIDRAPTRRLRLMVALARLRRAYASFAAALPRQRCDRVSHFSRSLVYEAYLSAEHEASPPHARVSHADEH